MKIHKTIFIMSLLFIVIMINFPTIAMTLYKVLIGSSWPTILGYTTISFLGSLAYIYIIFISLLKRKILHICKSTIDDPCKTGKIPVMKMDNIINDVPIPENSYSIYRNISFNVKVIIMLGCGMMFLFNFYNGMQMILLSSLINHQIIWTIAYIIPNALAIIAYQNIIICNIDSDPEYINSIKISNCQSKLPITPRLFKLHDN